MDGLPQVVGGATRTHLTTAYRMLQLRMRSTHSSALIKHGQSRSSKHPQFDSVLCLINILHILTSTHLRSTLILSSHLHLRPEGSPCKYFILVSTMRATYPAHIAKHNKKLHVVKLFITQLSPFSCHVLTLGFKYTLALSSQTLSLYSLALRRRYTVQSPAAPV